MAKLRCGHIQSCALYGISGILVDIEVTILPGLPAFEIVGLGDSAVRESRNRVHAAIKNNGFEFPASRVVACYAPAWLRKEGSGFDLPLALAVLMASGQLPSPKWPVLAFGELSLTGEVRSVPGTICRVAACQEKFFQAIIVPSGNVLEAKAIASRQCLPVNNLKEAAQLMIDGIKSQAEMQNIANTNSSNAAGAVKVPDIRHAAIRDISTIIGQQKAVRALQIAAAGRHNLLLLGSPGCGKTTLASILPDIMPPLELNEAIQVTQIYSASGLLKDGDGLIWQRPFRSPHHTITRTALTGGGSIPAPGEISLAHLGILFLDEMTEFMPETLDLLRQPLEEQAIRLTRLYHKITYPADFMLIGAANPCRCGEYLEPSATCRCTAESIRQHLNRLSGPLVDRMDLAVEMTRLSANELQKSAAQVQDSASKTADFAKSIEQCWTIQKHRCQKNNLTFSNNGRLSSTRLAEIMEIPDPVVAVAADMASRFRLSVRGFQKMLRISRTIADLEEHRIVALKHMAEAFQYRLRQPD